MISEMNPTENNVFNPWKEAKQQLISRLTENGFSTDCSFREKSGINFSIATNLLEFSQESEGLSVGESLTLFMNQHFEISIEKLQEESFSLLLLPKITILDSSPHLVENSPEREIINEYYSFLKLLLVDD